MPDFLVGPAQTYTTIQAAIDAVIAIGDLAGLGDHNIIIDDGFVHDGTLVFTGMQAKADGRVYLRSSGQWTMALQSGFVLRGYITLRDFAATLKSGFTPSIPISDGNTVGNIVENFVFTNPNNINESVFIWSASWRTNTVRDGRISGFKGEYKNAIHQANLVERVTVYNNYNGIRNCSTVTDCVAASNTIFNFGNNAVLSHCAASDESATGTGSITNIVATDEFVDPANGDFTLKPGSQLFFAGSTGNNIGWDQSAPVTATISLSGVYAPGNAVGITFTNFDGIPETVNLSVGNISMNPVVYDVDGDYFFDLPALPDSGNSAAGLPFGELITVTATDPGP